MSNGANKAGAQERIMPSNEDAERAVLGAILMNHEECLVNVAEVLNGGWQSFYNTGHAIIYKAILELYGDNKTIDVVTVSEQLSKDGKIDAVGGSFYVTTLIENVVTTANAVHHAEIVRDKYTLRRIIRAAGKMTESAYSPAADVELVIATADLELQNIQFLDDNKDMHILTPEEISIANATYIDMVAASPGRIIGIPSGFEKFDRITGGFNAGSLYIIAGRPSMGKTSFALDVAMHCSFKSTGYQQLFPVLYISIEMDKIMLGHRMLSKLEKIDVTKINSGFLNRQELESLTDGCIQICNSNIYLTECKRVNYMRMREIVRKFKRQHPECKLVVVDHLQLLDQEPNMSENEALGLFTKEAKILAQEQEVAFLMLCQLNRACEKRSPPRPMMPDLSGSGKIEQDGDNIIALYRPSYYDISQKPGICEFVILKQKQGPVGIIELYWNEKLSTFGNLVYDGKSVKGVNQGETEYYKVFDGKTNQQERKQEQAEVEF